VTRHVPALVIGGGISGLVCAYALHKAGIETELVEASPRPGGVIQSITRDGFLLELGPQSFSSTPALRQLCTELRISDEIIEAPPHSPRYVLIDGKLQLVPLSSPAFLASSLIDASTKWAFLRDIFGKSTPPDTDESIANFVRRKFSAQLLDRLVGPFVSGVYAGDPERLSVRSAFPQLYEAEKSSGSIVRGMMRLAKSKKGPRERPTLQTFRGGNASLVQSLSANLGPALQTNAKVTKLEKNENGYFTVHHQIDGKEDSLSASTLIFATPLDTTGKLLANLDPSFESFLSPVEFAAVAVVSLGYPKSAIGHSLDGFGFLVPRSAGLRVLGTVWNSSLFAGRAPDGHTLLTSFVGGTTDPAAAKLAPDNLSAIVHREISPILSINREPTFSNVTIWPRALPQYNLGHADRLAAVATLLKSNPGIWLTGNYLRGPAIGSCVEQALATAEEVAKWLTK
jgi:protoporphyrinogen/coproporphyrinogen III oxidase